MISLTFSERYRTNFAQKVVKLMKSNFNYSLFITIALFFALLGSILFIVPGANSSEHQSSVPVTSVKPDLAQKR